MTEVKDPFTLTVTNESEIFSTNSLYSFRARINPPVHIPFGSWETALTKIIIPNTRLIEMPETEFLITIWSRFFRGRSGDPRITTRVRLNRAFYHSLDQLIADAEEYIMNSILEIYLEHPSLSNAELGIIPGASFSIAIEHGRIRLSEAVLLAVPPHIGQASSITLINGQEFWRRLGFLNLNKGEVFRLPIRAEHIPSFTMEGSTLSLYAPNLVCESVCGDQLKPILEVIPMDPKSESDFEVFFLAHPIYKRLRGGYINYIQFELEDVNQTQLIFESGKIQLELHFRPCRPTRLQSSRRF